MTPHPMRERRKRATRVFYIKVAFVTLMIGAISYAAWLAPWARTKHTPTVEITR
jgi:hypothetical protein